jgi:hypothetical protein
LNEARLVVVEPKRIGKAEGVATVGLLENNTEEWRNIYPKSRIPLPAVLFKCPQVR